MKSKPSASPRVKPLFLALHPPRRMWPDAAGVYLGSVRPANRTRS